jgi:glycosyltransferase involved in cell wall biosynthesis
MSAPARILIVTAGPLCRNPRPYKEATALAAAGYAVTVLAPAYTERYEELDRALLRGAGFAKLELNLRVRDPGLRPAAAASRLLTRWARYCARYGLQSAQALGPVTRLTGLALRQPADLTIVHTEVGFAVGVRLARQGRRIAADFEDWHSRDLLPAARRSRPLRLITALEQTLLRTAAYASTTSEAMAAALQAAAGGPRPVVIRNVFPLGPCRPPTPAAGPPAFFWFSQTIGPGRMLEAFVAAWNLTVVPGRLCLLGEVSAEYRRKLESRVAAERRGLLEFLPLVPPHELPALIARHDVGLALEARIPENKDLTASNKIFQYLNAGIPVLATDTAGQQEVMAAAPGAGRVIQITQTRYVAAQMDEIARNADLRAAMGAAARRAAEATLCWEREAERLRAAVAAALGGSPAPERRSRAGH